MKTTACYWIAICLSVGSGIWLIARGPGPLGDPERWAHPADWFNGILWDAGPPAIGTIGRLEKGKFEEIDGLSVWMASSKASLKGIDPSLHLYGQIIRRREDFPASPPTDLQARIQSFRANGDTVSPGVLARFVLISSDASFCIYRTEKPFMFFENVEVEGEYPDINAIAGDDFCLGKIIAD